MDVIFMHDLLNTKHPHLVLTFSMLIAVLGFWLSYCTFILKMPYFHTVCTQPLYLNKDAVFCPHSLCCI